MTWLASFTVGFAALGAFAADATPPPAQPADSKPPAEAAQPADPKPPAEATPTAKTAPAAALDGWSADLEKALEKAKTDKKCVLVEFTGSDWCPPCIAMRKSVFSKKEFTTEAAKNYILVELDFPNGDKELVKKNQPLAEKYQIKVFPTVVLIDPDGKEFTRFTASLYPNPAAFLNHLDEALEKKDLD